MNGYMNKNEYKNAMSGVRPSEDVVERIMDMTESKNKNKGRLFKQLAATSLALAVLVGGGFGVNSMIKKEDESLSVIVAFADEAISIKSATKQHLCYSLYIAPADDKEKNEKYLAKAQAEYDRIKKEGMTLGEQGEFAAWRGVGNFDVSDPVTGDTVAKIYTADGGLFATNKKDYDNVKSFTVENESKYGIIQFETKISSEISEKIVNEEYHLNENDPYDFFRGHKFTLTGDELRHSQKNYNGDYGYDLSWDFSDELYNAVLENPDFDVTEIKDKITFIYQYDDGTIERASVNISFDNDGHMVLDNA